MKMALIGHRGTGKSSLLKRLKVYFEKTPVDLKFFDLDREIEARDGKSVAKIFLESGEIGFRKIETQVFQELIQNPHWVIALGAGFPLKEIPSQAIKIWVRRPTDHLGRIFIDRPRLNSELTALEEYIERLPLREERYRQQATEQYLMPEGIHKPNSTEKKIFQQDFQNLGGVYTLLPSHFQNIEMLQERIRKFEVEHFELRDDLLSLSQIQMVTSLLPSSRVLISLRNPQTHPWLLEFIKTGVLWDWASELGNCSFAIPAILSFHQIPSHLLQSASALAAHLSQASLSSHIKLSPIVENFETLKILIDWQRSNPKGRSLLPRSPLGAQQGRWTWVRLWLKGRQKLNFFRTDQGSAIDQPTLYQWITSPSSPEKFAAVIGSPVFHSRSPIEHEEFFRQIGMPFFAIDCTSDEFKDCLILLEEMGLHAAAVTAPLKQKAFSSSKYRTSVATNLKSANTLIRKNNQWNSHNTDLIGFQKMFAQISTDPNSIAVWGGGGTLPVILEVCPQALCFSARTGEIKPEYEIDRPGRQAQNLAMRLEGPQALIWAASPDANFPPESWKPDYILDLNYREDSLARDYAIQVKALYISGLVMFETQARAQQEFWSE